MTIAAPAALSSGSGALTSWVYGSQQPGRPRGEIRAPARELISVGSAAAVQNGSIATIAISDR